VSAQLGKEAVARGASVCSEDRSVGRIFSCILPEKLSENLCYNDPKRRVLCSFHAHSRCVSDHVVLEKGVA
jgi:hypothetical protein